MTDEPVPMHPARSAQVEAWIDEHGVKWTFLPDVSTDEFDAEASLKNQARIHQVLNEVQLDTYIEAMKRGDIFPAVVVRRNNKGKFVIVDGNHRLQAAIVAGVSLAAYVLDKNTDANAVLLMTYEANTRHGLPNSMEDRLRHAIFLLENVGATHESAAAAVNAPRNSVTRAWGKYKADQRARKVGLRPQEWDVLNPSVRTRINSLELDEMFRRVADLAFRAKLTADETDTIVVRINAAGSLHDQQKILEDVTEQFRGRIQQIGAGTFRGRVQGPRQHLSISLGHLNAAQDKGQEILRGVTEPEVEDMRARIQRVTRFLQDFDEALANGFIGEAATKAAFNEE